MMGIKLLLEEKVGKEVERLRLGKIKEDAVKEIYIVTCYSLIPTIVATATGILLSHVLSPDEFVFVTIFQTICTAYTFIILAVGIMKVHDYEFGKFLGTTVVTVIAMLIIVFLIFLVFMLAQQVYGWIGTVFTELKYR